MNLTRKLILNFVMGMFIWFASGCANTNGNSSSNEFAKWADSSSCNCRLAIVPQHLPRSQAWEIADKYNAAVFYEPSLGFINDTLVGGLSHSVGAASPKSWGLVRNLAESLEIINSTGKHWDIFVMAGASYLFSQTLKTMPDNGLSTANGTVHLVGWKKAADVEDAVQRISNGKFNVVYEK